MYMFRIGQGYDVHRLTEGRALVLGGVNIPFTHGLEGHSDADVLCHAVMDAMLGAVGLGDIGQHFSDTTAEYKDISSLILLARVAELVESYYFTVENIDATIIAQAPKLAAYRTDMEVNISEHARAFAVNVKFTTEEGLGFTGAGKGIAAQAVCLLKRRDIL